MLLDLAAPNESAAAVRKHPAAMARTGVPYMRSRTQLSLSTRTAAHIATNLRITLSELRDVLHVHRVNYGGKSWEWWQRDMRACSELRGA